MGFRVQVVNIRIGAFIEPVRGDAGLGNSMHVGRANLHFDGSAIRPPQSVVQ